MDFSKYEWEYVKKDHKGNSVREHASRALFKTDLGIEFGLSGKVLDIVFQKAWEDGHAYGYQEVFNHFMELDNFVTEIVNAFKSDQIAKNYVER